MSRKIARKSISSKRLLEWPCRSCNFDLLQPMPENTDNKKVFSLLEVTQSIQKTLSERYKSVFWVKAEMNKLNHYPQSGHCYPDLVEKKDGRIIAQLRSTLWKDDYLRINRDFKRIVKTPLTDGIQILFCARIMFDPTYGLSLRIMDIDPTFSLGELERERQETLDRLEHEGVINKNKSAILPRVPKRIAVISVQTSKGYADFLKVVEQHRPEYHLQHMLFPSLLQGDKAVQSITQQLRRIKRVAHHFDAVAIIRGGGGEVGLSCFNHYQLAREVATFPIPVITGIGHATNETVVEIISYKNAITPTDLANFLIEKFRQFDYAIRDEEKSLAKLADSLLQQAKHHFSAEASLFKSVAKGLINDANHSLTRASQNLSHGAQLRVRKEKDLHHHAILKIRSEIKSTCVLSRQQLDHLKKLIGKDSHQLIESHSLTMQRMEHTLRHLDPTEILKRGFSYTTHNGHLLTSASVLRPGDTIVTTVIDGKIISTITDIKK